MHIVRCENINGKIDLKTDVEILRKIIFSEGIALVKSAFEVEYIKKIKDGIAAWGNITPAIPHGLALQEISAETNFHRIDPDPQKSATPHVYHTYNFNRLDMMPNPLGENLYQIFNSMRQLQNSIAGLNAEFSPTGVQYKLRPQVIHYPSGGGFFAEHKHPLEPQRVGLIVSLSQRGDDFETGGTTFKLADRIVDTQFDQNIGDIVLFKYDVPHAVTVVDPNLTIDWSSTSGRWSMVLGYY